MGRTQTYTISFTTESGEAVTFPLEWKREWFGPVEVSHYWIDVRKLYGQRGRSRALCQNFAEAFWQQCLQQKTDAIHDNRQTYLLTLLLPHAKPISSNRVFLDARLITSVRKAAVHELEGQLEEGLGRKEITGMSKGQFRIKIRKLMRHGRLSKELEQKYREFEDRLLVDACALLPHDSPGAFRLMLERWQEFMQRWSKRGGSHLERKVLDVFSYECRAALHRCYSAGWASICHVLRQEGRISDLDEVFLQNWHGEPFQEEKGSLFCGHVFALHPGVGLMIQTPTGKRVMGEWLKDPGNRKKFGIVLHCIYVALEQYRRCYSEAQLRRRLVEDQKRWAQKAQSKKPIVRETDAR